MIKRYVYSFTCAALKRADSSASSTKRKVSSISISDTSDHDGADMSFAEDASRVAGNATAEKEELDPIAAEMAKFELPEEENQLDANMPWLRVVSQLINSFNFHCTHQGFCHPNCYRRQMRGAKRLMEAARHVSKSLY